MDEENMLSDLSGIVVSIAIFLFIFFAIFLFVYKKGDRLTKIFLGSFFLALGLAIIDIYLLTKGIYNEYPQFAFILNSLPLIYGPLLWLLTKAVTKSKNRFTQFDLIHFIPVLSLEVAFLFIYHFRDIGFKEQFLIVSQSNESSIPGISSFLVFISMIIYLVACIYRVTRYRKRIKEQYSNVDKVNLGWLLHVLIGFTIILCFSILMQISVYYIQNGDWVFILLSVLLFSMLIFIMSSIIRGLNADVLISDFIDENLLKEISPKDGVDNELLNKIISDVQKEKLFLDSNIQLKNLAEHFDLKSRDLSILINKGRNQSFFDFINSFRIGHAKELIKNPEDPKVTILEIMYESGFNSKSSFNTAFKKHAKLTPSEWKKMHR